MHRVYLITNRVNDRVYVGQTRKPVHQRLRQHFYEAQNGRHARFMPLIRAIRKHGPENFTIQPQVECATLEEANRREQLFIIALRADDPRFGYNRAPGGFNHEHLRGQKRSRESRRKMRAAAKPGVPRKTHCPKGHAYSGENLIVTMRGDGRKRRSCRECARERDRNRDRVKNKGVGRGGVFKLRSHCKKGHPFGTRPVVINGVRYCRICQRRKSKTKEALG